MCEGVAFDIIWIYFLIFSSRIKTRMINRRRPTTTTSTTATMMAKSWNRRLISNIFTIYVSVTESTFAYANVMIRRFRFCCFIFHCLQCARRWLCSSCHWVQSVTCRRWNARDDFSLTWVVIGTVALRTPNTRFKWDFNWTVCCEQMNMKKWNRLDVSASETYWIRIERLKLRIERRKKNDGRLRKWKWTAKSHPFCGRCNTLLFNFRHYRAKRSHWPTSQSAENILLFFCWYFRVVNVWISLASTAINSICAPSILRTLATKWKYSAKTD